MSGRVVLGAAVGRTTLEDTVAKTDARIAALADLRQRPGSMLVTHLDRLADGAPVVLVAHEVVRDVDRFAGRAEGNGDVP